MYSTLQGLANYNLSQQDWKKTAVLRNSTPTILDVYDIIEQTLNTTVSKGHLFYDQRLASSCHPLKLIEHLVSFIPHTQKSQQK